MHILFLKIRKNKKIVLCSIILFILFTFELIYKLYIFHPYQSLYLNNFVSKNSKSLYEADYQSLSRFNGILDILNDSKKNKITIATASWTPLKNAISLISSKNKKKLYFTGTANKEEADYIYTNYFYEVDVRYNNKYNIPNNFYLFKTLYSDDIRVYSIYKKKS